MGCTSVMLQWDIFRVGLLARLHSASQGCPFCAIQATFGGWWCLFLMNLELLPCASIQEGGCWGDPAGDPQYILGQVGPVAC